MLKHILILALLIAVGAYWHAQAGATLPFPCGDEVVFYYPAQALAEHATLASAHLDPDREVFWMPPAYMTALAVWLKAVGEGLEAARWLSYVLSAGALIGLWRLYRRLALPPEALVLLGAAFLARHWIVMGNMIRMEALLLCLLLLALHALWQGRTLAGAALAALSLTVHPNGVYFVVGLPALAALAPVRTYGGRANVAVAVLCGGMIGAYGIDVLLNFSHFVHDWTWQLGSRPPGGLRLLLFRPDQAVFFAALCGLAWWAWRERRRNIGFVLLVATLFWMMRVLGQGWAYGVFNILAVTLVLSCGLAWARVALWPRLPLPLRRPAPWVAVALLVPALMAAQIYSLPFYRPAYHWMGMGMQTLDKPYFTEADRTQIRAYLYRTLPAGRRHRIYYMPEGDGMLIEPADTGRLLHVLPIFGKNLPDYVIAHASAVAPFFEDAFTETMQMLPPGSPPPAPFYTRQGTEKWYLIPARGRYPPYILLKGDPRLPKE